MLFLFPFFSWALLLLIISYINDIGPNPRIKKIENILEKGTNRKKTELKYQLQNECVMSMLFVLYTFILSILAMISGVKTEDHLHEEVSKYFFLDKGSLGLLYSLSFVPLVQDGVMMVLMILSILLPWMVIGIVGFVIILSAAIIMLILLISYYTASLFFVPPVLVGVVFLVVFRIHYCKEIKYPSIKTGSNLYKDISAAKVYIMTIAVKIQKIRKRGGGNFVPIAVSSRQLVFSTI